MSQLATRGRPPDSSQSRSKPICIYYLLLSGISLLSSNHRFLPCIYYPQLVFLDIVCLRIAPANMLPENYSDRPVAVLGGGVLGRRIGL